MFFKISAIKTFAAFIEKTLSFFMKLVWNFIQKWLQMQLYSKDTPTQVFSLEYYEIFKSAFFHRTPLDGCLWSVIGQSNCGNRQLVKSFMWSWLTNAFLCLLNKRFPSTMFSPASQIKYHTFWWLFTILYGKRVSETVKFA